MEKTKFPSAEMAELWDELDKELTTRNGYCPEPERFKLIQLIKDQESSSTKILDKGYILYRARVLTEKIFIELVKNTFENTKDIHTAFDAYDMTVEGTPSEKTDFFGLGIDQCDAPPI